jgi:ceramide glucosyltransferase
VPAVERLINEFPAASVKLVVCPQVSGSNLKVSNLLQMLPMARHEYFVVNDSDIAVPSDYLRKVMAPLAIVSVGIVTCLYRGIAGKTLGSRLESLGISSDFIPGVLCARQLENGLHFAMGSTLAFRRCTLEIIGGLEAVADYLADDYELGRRITEAGLQVQLADCIVEHYLPEFSLTAFFEHQLRWARTIRSSRPAGYAGLILTYAIPWSLLSLIVSGGVTWTWLLLSTALLLRFAVLWAYERVVLRDKQVRRHWLLLPLRDCLAVLTWAACYMGRQVVWRGKKFELANGKMRPRFDVTAGNNQ